MVGLATPRNVVEIVLVPSGAVDIQYSSGQSPHQYLATIQYFGLSSSFWKFKDVPHAIVE